MTSSQRPRPRARKASSNTVTLVSPIESVTSTLTSTLSPPPPSSRVVVNDDDDDFFTRKKVVTKPGRTKSAPMLDINIPENSEEEMDVEEHVAGGSSDNEGHRRKRPRRQMPLWTKSASFNKIEPRSRQASSSQDEDNVLSLDSRATRKRASRSPSLTPPPALDKEVLQRLQSVLDQYNVPKPADVIDDEESFSADAGAALDLDPDLVRMIKGDRAREQRKHAKEREARLRLEEERLTKSQSVLQKTLPETSVIEVEDSEEEEDIPPRGHVQRNRDSSSPVVFVSQSMSARRETQIHLASPVREASPEPIADETERLSLTMKGGEGGNLQAMVKVKPTTQIKKLLDHFKDLHKAAIPKAKLRSVRIRFDGDWLDPTTTVGDAGIEDEEQMDVVW